MKHKLLTLAGALALLAVLGKFYAKPLFAQVRSALVKNIDEPGRAPYQVPVFCQAATCNFIALTPVPAHSRLVIEHVSLDVGSGSGSPVLTIRLGVPFQGPFGLEVGPPFTFLPFTAVLSGIDFYVNQTVQAYFEAGITPALQVGVGQDGGIVFGSVSGHIVDLNQ